MIRVLIVDDSPLVRSILHMVLGHVKDIEVVGEAGDGLQAETKVQELRPDVVTMDVLMPMRDGLETIQAIMLKCPTPIVVVADAHGDTQKLAMEALGQGAMEVFPKPSGGFDDDATKELVGCIRRSARVRLRAPSPVRRRKMTLPSMPTVGSKVTRLMVGIVGSTGSPQVLRAILAALPEGYPHPIAIVQHTAHGFTNALASWLDASTELSVAVAKDKSILKPGRVAIAPDDAHLEIGSTGVLKIHKSPPVEGHRPAGTVLLRSIAASYGGRSVGIVLSGMGRDGAAGISAIDASGGTVIVENPDTATVASMPREAIARSRAPTIDNADALRAHLLRLSGQLCR